MEQHVEHLEEASSAESPAFPSTFENINNRKNNRQESRKGIPWTEEEHRWGFFVSTVKGTGETFPGTATQVATHAQKYYYLRQLSEGKEKMKPSIHDTPTVHRTDATPSNNYNFHHIRSLL